MRHSGHLEGTKSEHFVKQVCVCEIKVDRSRVMTVVRWEDRERLPQYFEGLFNVRIKSDG